jgi:hypothetical protein
MLVSVLQLKQQWLFGLTEPIDTRDIEQGLGLCVEESWPEISHFMEIRFRPEVVIILKLVAAF